MREPNSCAAVQGEINAFFKQGYLIARHGLRKRELGQARRTDRAVLFVHGFLAAAPVFDPLRERVEREHDLPTYDHTYLPIARFDEIAERLSEVLVRVTETGAKVSIVGHSLGGLLARTLVQERGFAPYVDRIVTLATPHIGTTRAPFVPGTLITSLRPSSPVFERLAATSDRLSEVRCVAIGAAQDEMIVPRRSAVMWPGAEVHWLQGLGHNAILFDERVHDIVLDALR